VSRVFLIGFMGAGKSGVGRALAAELGLPFVDLDSEVEKTEGLSVAQIFERDGEQGFRRAERAALAAVSASADAVVACGGGVVLDERNRALMRSSGVVLMLDVSAEEALTRVGSSRTRPLLQDADGSGVRDMLQERMDLYRATAHHIVATVGRSVLDVTREACSVITSSEIGDIDVSAGAGYTVFIGASLMDETNVFPGMLASRSRVAIVTDSNVGRLHAVCIERSLREAGVDSFTCTLEPGETSKNWLRAGTLLEEFALAGLDRQGAVLALGGGVVGDLAGFCAAVYMRGVPVVQVPTTLLAQVDSSIGGKTGVDLAAGKNLAGAFWQPAAVLSDVTLLNTLPDAEWHNGMAEAVKTALLAGPEAVAQLTADAVDLAARDEAAVLRCVRMCAGFKARVVSADERESGMRECLNLGHTLGHAIEKVAGYGTVGHGVAVAEGLRFAAFLSARLLGAPSELQQRVNTLLDVCGVPRYLVTGSVADLAAAMSLDKKARGGVVRFVLLRDVGDWVVVSVEPDVARKSLADWLDRS